MGLTRQRPLFRSMVQVLSDLTEAAGELGLGPRPLAVNANQEEGELEVTVKDGLTGEGPGMHIKKYPKR